MLFFVKTLYVVVPGLRPIIRMAVSDVMDSVVKVAAPGVKNIVAVIRINIADEGARTS